MTIRFLTTVCFLFLGIQLNAQSEPTGLPGDGFSLEGALELFKQAESPEDFERKLNSEDKYVNNLDLNEDGDIDFVRVVDHMEKDLHAIVLQVALDKNEMQDIAVIELEKTGAEEATLQIIGDEDLYGEQLIVEPSEMSAKSIGKGPNIELELTRIVVNVWAWPSVRFVYRPSYRVYVSPYRWGTSISWWRPWKPRTWVACNNYRLRHYRPHYRVARTHRVVQAHRVYQPHRKTTTVVRTRTVKRVAVNKQVGRKTTTVKAGKVNNRAVVGKKTTTTRAASGNGNKVAGQKTTTRKVGRTKSGKVRAQKTTTTKRAATNGKRKVAKNKKVTRKKG